jgi:hypothetical protein
MFRSNIQRFPLLKSQDGLAKDKKKIRKRQGFEAQFYQ